MKTEQHATLLSEQHSYTSKILLVILLTVCHTILFVYHQEYNIREASGENKDKYQLRDYLLIQ